MVFISVHLSCRSMSRSHVVQSSAWCFALWAAVCWSRKWPSSTRLRLGQAWLQQPLPLCVEVMRIKTVTSPNVECSAPGHSSYVATPGDGHSQAATGCFHTYLTTLIHLIIFFASFLKLFCSFLPCFYVVAATYCYHGGACVDITRRLGEQLARSSPGWDQIVITTFNSAK